MVTDASQTDCVDDQVCDGNGAIAALPVADDTEVPPADANECTQDVCSGGVAYPDEADGFACTNPADGRAYVISYNDCCGVSSCGQCLCNRNEGDRPQVRPQANNDYNWCLGSESSIYNCSVAAVIGVALPEAK